MKLENFLKYLEHPAIVELENESNKIICITLTDSEGIEPYLNREIISWRMPNLTLECHNIKADLCIKLFDANKRITYYADGNVCAEVKDNPDYPGISDSGIAPELLYNGADH